MLNAIKLDESIMSWIAGELFHDDEISLSLRDSPL